MRAFAIPISRYRRAGADPPWFDPRRYHGVAMEGYFWRFTHAATGRVAIVMCGVNRSSAGERWAFVGLAVHPGGFFRWAALQDAAADAGGYGVRAGAAFSAGPDHVALDLGPDCRLDAALRAPLAWPKRAYGGLGGAHALPGLTQYWHPHLFAADVRGSVVAGGDAFTLDGAGAYAEKNWGGRFPDRWWWGQAHDFNDDVSVAFAGGPVGIGPATVDATAVVVRLDGTVLRCRPTGAVELGTGSWRLARPRGGPPRRDRGRGRSRHRARADRPGAVGAPGRGPLPAPPRGRAPPPSAPPRAHAVRRRLGARGAGARRRSLILSA